MNLADVLLFPVTGPIKGTLWLIEQIQERVNDELYNPDTLRNELIQVRIAYERRQLTDAEYAVKSKELWERLNTVLLNDIEGDEDGTATYPEQ